MLNGHIYQHLPVCNYNYLGLRFSHWMIPFHKYLQSGYHMPDTTCVRPQGSWMGKMLSQYSRRSQPSPGEGRLVKLRKPDFCFIQLLAVPSSFLQSPKFGTQGSSYISKVNHQTGMERCRASSCWQVPGTWNVGLSGRAAPSSVRPG